MISMVRLAVFLLFQLKITVTLTIKVGLYNPQQKQHVLDYVANYESLLSTLGQGQGQGLCSQGQGLSKCPLGQFKAKE